jgi:prepilin-type N-terminal cleavage/methylation domain-containing protein
MVIYKGIYMSDCVRKLVANTRHCFKGFTLVELLVVISIIAMLLAVLMPALSKAREQGKKVICMSDLRQLSTAWISYANSNNDALVFGATSRVTRVGYRKLTFSPTTYHPVKSWVMSPMPASDCLPAWAWKDRGFEWYQDECIRMGTLYPYLKNFKVYRCPAGNALDNSRSYAISSYLNGYYDPTDFGSGEANLRRENVATKSAEVRMPGQRILFICQGGVPITANGGQKNYSFECFSSFVGLRKWRDVPPAVHMNKSGTSLSFADGHAEFWTWKRAKVYASPTYDGKTQDGTRPGDDEDFNRLYNATWPKILY